MYRENPKLASNPKFRLADAKLAIAPHVGARIETLAHSGHDNANVIASHADARIETTAITWKTLALSKSHLNWCADWKKQEKSKIPAFLLHRIEVETILVLMELTLLTGLVNKVNSVNFLCF